MKSYKIILDTNLWISFLITGNYDFIDKSIENKNIKLVFSEELIQEFLSVVARPKLKKYFTDKDVESILQTFNSYGIFIQVTSNIQLCRDSNDDFLLNLAVDSKSDFLVTGDKDLLEIKAIEGARIITIKELEEKKTDQQ